MDTLQEGQVEALYSLAFANYQSGLWNQAEEIFLALCEKCPLEGRFWFGLGASLQEGGKFQDALKAWAMTALLQKEDPYPHFHAAECYLSIQDSEEAKKALEEAGSRLNLDHPLKEKVEILQKQWERAI